MADKNKVAIVFGALGAGLSALLLLLGRKAETKPGAKFYMSAMTVEVTDGFIFDMYWRCKFSATVTNRGTDLGTYTLTGKDNLAEEWGGPRTWGPQSITLAPGQSYIWSVWYDIDFRNVPSPYSWELFGDWETNNHSRGDAVVNPSIVNPVITVLGSTWDRSPLVYAPNDNGSVIVSFYNQTDTPWDYNAYVIIGGTSFLRSFSLNPKETKDITFAVQMPPAEGQYSAFLSVYSGMAILVQDQIIGSVVTSYSWNFTGGLSASCYQYFDNPDYGCYLADISYSISNPAAPNFKWALIYWDYGWTNTYGRGGNGATSGTVRCSGGAILYAHPDPNAVLAGSFSEAGGFIQTSNFKEVARIGGHELGNI